MLCTRLQYCSTCHCVYTTCMYMYMYIVNMHCRWLLHDPKMILRSNYAPYATAVKRYFRRLFTILVPLQSAYGGPIIGFQVENEYAYWTNDTATGHTHLKFLYKVCTYHFLLYTYYIHVHVHAHCISPTLYVGMVRTCLSHNTFLKPPNFRTLRF